MKKQNLRELMDLEKKARYKWNEVNIYYAPSFGPESLMIVWVPYIDVLMFVREYNIGKCWWVEVLMNQKEVQ